MKWKAFVCVIGFASLGSLSSVAYCQAGATPIVSQDVPSAKTPGKAVVLPEPLGPFGIGRIGYEWTDASRHDDFSADSQAHRDLMVYLWYPAAPINSSNTGIYLPGAIQMNAATEVQPIVKEEFGGVWPQIVSGELKSHAIENAPLANPPKAFPVVLFSHGLGGTGFEYTCLIEDLVSHGYIVVAIEHTDTALAVLFPKGKIIHQRQEPMPVGLSADERMQHMMASAGRAISQGAGDVVFVLDKLASLNHSGSESFPLGGRLDLTRVAAAGHSAGGAFATRACQLDARFRACISLDGALPPVSVFPEFPDKKKLQQPVLLLEVDHTSDRMPFSPEQYNEFLKIKDAELKLCPPGSYDVLLKSAGLFHGSFSDYRLLAANGRPSETEQALHNLSLIESFTRAFLDKTLNQAKEPLLDSPSQSAEANVKEYGN
jgi:pimeloyl-ACP methyl ester carboxylesterase